MIVGPRLGSRVWERGLDVVQNGRRRRSLARRDFSQAPAGRASPPVIVSLTSHRARFPFLGLAARSLLDQSEPAEAVVLWLAAADRVDLPVDVERLTGAGLEIRVMDEDRGSASKLLPAMNAYPDRVIVTADDDVVYEHGWLASLLAVHRVHPAAIACIRAHYLAFTESGELRPYLQWEGETRRLGPDSRLFFTGHGGVLYPPGSLAAMANDDGLRQELCPLADDVWFNWMARLAGTPIVRAGRAAPRRDAVPGSQGSTLLASNVNGGGNDVQIRRMVAHFGSLDPCTGCIGSIGIRGDASDGGGG